MPLFERDRNPFSPTFLEKVMEQLNQLSALLPEFLRRYPPAEGFSVQTEILDSFSVQPGWMKLYEIALHGGHPPESLGLPPLRSRDYALIGRATLRDPKGRILASATASQVTPDVERLETAARHRLLAALGFEGELVEADEAGDPRDPGLAITPEVPAHGPASETRAESGADTAPAVSVNDVVVVATETPGAEAADAVTPVDAAIPAEPPLDRALPLLQRQNASLARLRGVAAPEVHTRSEGHAALKTLMQQPVATVG